MSQRLLPLALATLATLSSVLVGVPVTADAGAATVTIRVRQAVRELPVAAETRTGYDRDRFRHWVDADGDCRDTRDEVLAAESRVRVSGCDIRSGQWRSYYDGVVTRSSSDFDIDHLVPLAEAWDSGAHRWTAETRRRFANDLGDSRTLVAVTASSNRSKSDRDPAEWLPQRSRCRYVVEWVAVKLRWRLKVDSAEKRALTRRTDLCRNTLLTVRRAVVVNDTATEDGGGSDPRYSTCGEAIDHGYGPYYRERDLEYSWYVDGDSDGVVCES